MKTIPLEEIYRNPKKRVEYNKKRYEIKKKSFIELYGDNEYTKKLLKQVKKNLGL